MKYRLGIDVGGTNTDAVILDEANRVVASCKEPTSADVSGGIDKAVERILRESRVPAKDIVDAMLGTTHATNAIVERKSLSKVAAIRLASPSGLAIPPFVEWPEDLLKVVGCGYRIVKGGYEYNGAPISRPDKDEIKRAIGEAAEKGAEALAISSAFAPVNGECEELALSIAREVLGAEFPVTLSREIGSIGLIERENAAILNAAIRRLAERAYGSFKSVLAKHGVPAVLFITQNDGTLMGHRLRHALPHTHRRVGTHELPPRRRLPVQGRGRDRRGRGRHHDRRGRPPQGLPARIELGRRGSAACAPTSACPTSSP